MTSSKTLPENKTLRDELPKTPSFRLDGKRALVTGASRGIGMGAAVALADAGAHVVLVARSGDALSGIVDAIKYSGGSAQAFELDVTDTQAVRSFVNSEAAFDILVNNAGINRPGPMSAMSEADFDDVMNINVRAAYFVAQMVAERMLAEPNQTPNATRSIINTSSQMGHVGGVDRTVYCASKHAIEGISKAMAIELGPHNIRVNTICPTFIKTPLTESTFADPERVEWILSKIKLPRLGEITDVMGPVVFLASEASALITGSALMIDGGWTAG